MTYAGGESEDGLDFDSQAASVVSSASDSRDPVSATLCDLLPGESAAARSLREVVVRIAPFPTAVLLTGETGSGKGSVARAIHRAGPLRQEPFVQVDCAGLPDGLLEPELYGVARGAFTGAVRDRPGRFEAAGQGTLFLDEIGELSERGQRKLLRALEDRAFERVGETRTRHLAARIIAATHVDLNVAVKQGRFRADLYYRLHVLRLDVPPLRERIEDLDLWFRLASERAAKRLARPALELTPCARELIQRHRWPGNLRELFHFVEAATILADSSRLDAQTVLRMRAHEAPTWPHDDASGCQTGSASDLDRDTAVDAIRTADGNLSLAARRLGIPRSTLRYRAGRDDPLSRRRDRATRANSRPDGPRRP